MRRAKIVATIGPASESEERLRDLMLAGMDVARINMSHGERLHHGGVIARIRRVSTELKRPVAVLLDISGPKIRTGKIRGGETVLKDGSEVRITSEELEGDSACFSTNYKSLPRDVRPGDRILLDDGQIELQAVRSGETELVAEVIHGGILSDHKGVNLPGVRVSLPSITEKDIADLQFGIERGVDLVAQSFVRTAEDCHRACQLIGQFGGNAKLIAKIEKPEAVENFAQILEIADGVMIARGDLAVETSPERVPVLQKMLIRDSLIAQKPTITATQMLQSMIEDPRPTRAEASDVANAILDGSDAVMLSGETAIGRFPVETVSMMSKIICSAEAMQNSSRALVAGEAFRQSSGTPGRAIAEAAVLAAEELGCRLIVVITQSGNMAQRVSALRPLQRVIALTQSDQTLRQLALRWGVEPYRLEASASTEGGLLPLADRALLEHGLADRSERVVVMAGRVPDEVISLAMKIHTVGEMA